jgi:hypothetical protein
MKILGADGVKNGKYEKTMFERQNSKFSKASSGETEIEAFINHVHSSDIWDAREETFQDVNDSKNTFSRFTKEEKKVLKMKVLKFLSIMYDRIDEWLPESLCLDTPGERLSIVINLLTSEIEDEAIANFQITEIEAQKMIMEFENEAKYGEI